MTVAVRRNDLAKLGIGASRFGAPARAALPRGPSEAEAFAMVALAAEAGVRLVDLAGEASETIAAAILPRDPAFQITTKTTPPAEDGLAGVLRRARASAQRLEGRLGVLFVRPAALLLDAGGARLWDELQALRAEGLVGAIGISACHCDQPLALARRFRPEVMQLPLSLLDQRLLLDGTLSELAAEGVELHLRSVFLRGLLFEPGPAGEPPHLSRLRRRLAEAGADPMQAALSFALERVEASKVVVGVGSPLELRAVLAAARAPRPDIDWAALQPEQGPCRFDVACRAA